MENLPGTHRYVNRGYILLGLALAHVAGRPLDRLAADFWAELGMGRTGYGPVPQAPDVAPTEHPDGHDRLWGVAHDENAATMGGVAGHAGVFAPATDLATYAEHLLGGHGDPHETSPLTLWLRESLARRPRSSRASTGAWAGPRRRRNGRLPPRLHRDEPLPRPATGRYVVIATNAVHNGAPRVRLAPLRERALKILTG
ncbi:serine hydrolase [Streptomyces cirratus]